MHECITHKMMFEGKLNFKGIGAFKSKLGEKNPNTHGGVVLTSHPRHFPAVVVSLLAKESAFTKRKSGSALHLLLVAPLLQ